MSTLTDRQQLAYIAGQAADARLNVELETEGMTLNIGPQHPATHGTLRIVARLDGEQVIWAEPVAGYMHRGYEKLTEVRTFPQVTTLINRIDWLGSFANEVPFILAAEKLMDIEAPPRAQHIRTILFELSRIANIDASGNATHSRSAFFICFTHDWRQETPSRASVQGLRSPASSRWCRHQKFPRSGLVRRVCRLRTAWVMPHPAASRIRFSHRRRRSEERPGPAIRPK